MNIRKGLIKRIHVDTKVLRTNKKQNKDDPTIICRSSKKVMKAQRADIIVDGKVVASLVYKKEKPLSNGAVVWIETTEEVQLV